MLNIIAPLCVFLSILCAIYANRAATDEKFKHNFTILAFLSAVFATTAYVITFG